MTGARVPFSLPLTAYQRLTGASAPLLRGLLERRLARGKEDAGRIGERRGEPGRARPPGPLVWIHAVSVGEAVSVLPVIAALRARDPGTVILFTTGTTTSAGLVAERLKDAGVIHQFIPVDHPAWVARFLDHWRPDLGLLVESELWPNLLLGAEARKIPLVLLNARLSERSYEGWRLASATIKRLLSVFSLCLAQDRASAERLRALGARTVHMLGNLKFAAMPLPEVPDLRLDFSRALGARPRWLAASIHPGEDVVIAKAHLALCARLPDVVTIVVPRHPERGPAIAETFITQGLVTRRRAAGDTPDEACEIYIADTLGELGTFARLTQTVFMGGSLIPHGGQNPLEPARLGCAIVAGPHTDNFAEIYDQLEAAKALLRAKDAATLADAVALLLTDAQRRETSGGLAQRIATSAADVLPQILAALAPFLPGAAPPTEADVADARA